MNSKLGFESHYGLFDSIFLALTWSSQTKSWQTQFKSMKMFFSKH